MALTINFLQFIKLQGLAMIRNIAVFSLMVLVIAGCASNKGFTTTQSFSPARFNVDEVYVNIANGVENADRIRTLMTQAGENTAQVYNHTMPRAAIGYPLEFEVNEINYSSREAGIAASDRTFIRYVATLRVAETGETYRSLPVTYYHVAGNKVDTDEAKQNAERNMISLSIKSAFARLYGMEQVPQTIQTYFTTNDIFADEPATLEPDMPLNAPQSRVPVSTPSPEPQSVEQQPEIILAPDEPITATTTTEDGVTVIECVVC